MNSYETIGDLKKKIEKKERIYSSIQKLIYLGKTLENHLLVSEYNIQDKSTIYIVINPSNSLENLYFFDQRNFSTEFNCDFTKVIDNQIFKRGGEDYIRPCGWMKFAFNVGELVNTNDKGLWLGDKNLSGEWPVSYHGTGLYKGKTISEIGSENTSNLKIPNNYGIFSSPSIKCAEKFATKFKYQNYDYLVIFQNRVNPQSLIKVQKLYPNDDQYWITLNQTDIRPYSVLIKRV
ncbi:hypothetical protein DICPUDRAFT_89601 [Dictyostelium purpureum]|uniref:Ubiquitin-like domain-containing protein n=1 Tax=Dictyostelium purpureum TaxID=5786 RepID=F0ZWV4_DICPU|nr:uncharacterized protein DICPUDRAFT_89601 [Dictyostelium purpureum]EGC31581.1 hypothetical protein DICPUDRAFT_89601 [Dictyostelium purpureum]|eukprot:XP_003291892.1 hypothetical protein DICPUDRAFT_89601 [Dictyostelium purpureum]